MKTNHQRQYVASTTGSPNYYDFCKSGLKQEGNNARRRTDARALARFVNGDDEAVFSISNMGNPWHWD